MQAQEVITDLMLTEKKMSGNYSAFASECVNEQLRDTYVDLLTKGHKTQTELFKTAQQKGWYQVKPAQDADIQAACQKFGQMKCQLS